MEAVFVFLLLLGITSRGVQCSNSYLTPLANHLKTLSDPDVAPRKSTDSPLNLTILFAVLNVATVDTENNVVEMEGTVRFLWDSEFKWNPADYGDAEDITLPAKYFWVPPFQQITSAVKTENLNPASANLFLFNNGTFEYFTICRTKILCDVSRIESGVTCNTKFSIWGYSKDRIAVGTLQPDSIGQWDYFSGSKFQITGSNIAVTDFPFDGKIFQIIDFSVTIQRKPERHERLPPGAFFSWRWY